MITFFSHPSNLRTDDLVLPLRIDEGAAGYGIMLMLLEMLTDTPDRRLKYNPRALSFALNGEDPGMIERIIGRYGLFTVDGDGWLTSPWLDARMAAYDAKIAIAREAGAKGAAIRWAKAHQKNSDPMTTPSKKRGRPKGSLKQPQPKDIAIDNIIRDKKKINLPHEGEGEGDFFLHALEEPGAALTDDLVEQFCVASKNGHAPGYVAQICRDYHMGVHMYEAIVDWTEGAKVDSPRYQQFVSLVKTMRETGFRPAKPANYFAAKLEGRP